MGWIDSHKDAHMVWVDKMIKAGRLERRLSDSEYLEQGFTAKEIPACIAYAGLLNKYQMATIIKHKRIDNTDKNAKRMEIIIRYLGI
jgi:hypothetical protein